MTSFEEMAGAIIKKIYENVAAKTLKSVKEFLKYIIL